MFSVVIFLLLLRVAGAEKEEKENLRNELLDVRRKDETVGLKLSVEKNSDFWPVLAEEVTSEKSTSQESDDRTESLIGKGSAERNERNVNPSDFLWTEQDEEDPKDKPEIEIRGSSLAFVFDSTGSMSPELSQVKVGASKILEALSGNSDVPIHNYILVPFNDPAIGPVTVTTNHDLFKENIQNIRVSGGGDCPEMSVGAIKKALEQSLPNSYIYVFTDASAKDYRLQNEVLSLIQRKQSQVNFIMTDNCGDLSDPAHQVYEKISATSAGQIYWLNKLEVKEVLKYVKKALQSNVVNLLSQHKPAPPKDVPDEHEVLIDNTLKQFTVSVSGANASIRITDPKGKKVDGPPQLESLLNLSNVKIVNVREPDPGSWKVLINSDSDYMLRSTGRSEVNFDHGFSTVETVNMKETNYRPLQGAHCFLLIRTVDVNMVHNITMVDLVDVNGEIIERLHLESVLDVEGLYKTGAFVPPSQFFHIGISGYGKDGLPIKRITSTAINPQLPEKPIINVRSRVAASFNSSAILKCFVESAVPVTVRWYKDGTLNEDHKNCSQSCEAVLKIDKVTLQSGGNYTCVASNAAGTSLGSQYLDVIGEAPVVTVNSTVLAYIGENISIPCWVKSYLPYVVTWNQFIVKNESAGTLHPIRNGKVVSNHTLNLGPVQVEDEGWYVCIAENKVGRKQGRVFLVVNVPLTVVVEPQTVEYTEGMSSLFSCSASGKPRPKLEWWKQQKKIIDEDPSVKIEEINGYVNLVIDYLLKEHEGIYMCVASNNEELASAGAELIYTEEPKIKAKNETLRIKDGEVISVNCNASGEPKPTIKWYKDGNEIILDSRIEMNENGELIIKHTQTSDSGIFSCVATNKLGSDTNYFDLFVGTAPVFLQIPKDKKIEIFQKSLLRCSAIGVPLPKIQWTRRNNKELNPESMIALPSGELKILKMNFEDEGYYDCIASNDFGSITTEVKLEIYGIEKPVLNEILNISKLEVISGSDLTIPCGIRLGNPVGSVKWFKDNTVVEANDRMVVNRNGNLVLRNVETISRGHYTCFVSNIAGNSSRSIEISISESPRIAKNFSTNIKGQKGGEIIIPCPAEGFPVPSIIWKKNGRSLPLSPTIFQNENGSLTIKNLSEENSGTYTCIGENSVGSASQVISLRVQIPPIFTEDAQDQYLNIVEGYMVILNCNSKADPKATVKWYKNEKPLLQWGEIIQEQPELLRFVANLDDTGIYKCIATNEVGSASKEFNVTVLVPPNILDSKNGGSIKAKEGTRMVLRCKVHGVPTPTILWQRNGLYLTQNTSDVTLTDSGLLILENVTAESAGAYVCDAENLAGIMQRMYYVQVHYAPRIKEESNISHTISLKEGNEYALPCHVDGNPKPIVTWRKNGFVIRDDEKDNLLILGDNTLVFLQVSKNSKGIYRCEASNEEGSTFREHDIKVLTAPSLMPEGYHTSKKVNEGDPVELTCPVSNSIPQSTILWVKDGKPLNSLLQERSDEAQIKLSEDQRKLVIAEAHPSDKGNYSCSATNSAGRADAKFFLDVLMTPYFEEFNHVAHRTILVGGDVALNCSVSGNPQPKVTWRKENSPISPENNPGVHISLDKQYLVISNGKLYHTGTYICTAINEVSRKEREFYVTVLEPPFIMGSLYETVDAVTGSNVSLHCPFTGVPKPDVVWWKQGKTKVTVNNFSEDLEIVGINCEDGGIYICEVTNTAGTKIKKFNLTVLEPPHIELNNVVDKLVAHVGENVSLKCRAKGHPKPDITWLHNGHIINDIQSRRSRRQIKKFLGELQIFDDGLVTLTLSNITEDYEGLYTILASNKAGVIEKNFEVSVLSGPKFLENHNKTQTVTIVRAHPLILRCPVSGDPTPVIQWYHNYQKLSQNANVFLTKDELRIKNSNSNHSGTYFCSAENLIGNLTLVFQVKVIEPPKIKVTDTLFRLKVNETLEMKCEALQDEGITYAWFYRSVLVSNSSRLSVMNGHKKLMIPYVNYNDSGEYMCIVSNIAGITKVTYTVEVIEAPNQIILVDSWRNIQLHHPFLLNCPFDGRPEPNITWYFKGQEIVYNGSNNHIQIVGTYLMVHEAAAKDAGEYKCVAENLAGSKELKFVVDVYVSAKWSHWSAWSACTVTCGIGKQHRTRVCSTDYKELDNIIKTDSSKCSKESWIEEKECLEECPIDGGWGTWSSWTPYFSTCGKALRKRFRSCNNPQPFNNGKDCEGLGLEEEFKMMEACPINGEWSEWSQWSACSHSCDGGMKKRQRKCASPAPQYGGKFCDGSSKEFRICNKQKCQGEWHAWSEWSSCSVSCGRGQRKRIRKCAVGLACKGENLQIQKCSIRNCEDNTFSPDANLRIREKGLSEVRHKSEDMGSDGTLQVQIEVSGEVSVMEPQAHIVIHNLDQDYSQTSPSSPYSTVKNASGELGRKFPFTWNSRIFNNMERNMPYIIKKHLIKNIDNDNNMGSQNATYISTSTIRKNNIDQKCLRGFVYEPRLMHCIDVNECEDESFQCGSNQHCQNTFGSYNCICNEGYKMLNNSFTCVDVDECTETPNVCSHLCHNVEGSFFCSCPFHHYLDKDLRTCKEILYDHPEIYQNSKYILKKNTSCNSYSSKYEFGIEEISEKYKECPPGFLSFNAECKDLNECEDLQICDDDEICLNTLGSYQCLNAPCSKDFIRNSLTQNCIKVCSKENTCKNRTLVSETVSYSAVTLSSTSAVQSIAKLEVQGDKTVKVSFTKFQVMESGELFQIREFRGRGFLYAFRVLNKDTLYRVRVEANSYDENNVFVYNVNFILFVIVI